MFYLMHTYKTPHTVRPLPQMGAPEVAPHLERMQPASAPLMRPQRPAAMAGAMLKPSKQHVFICTRPTCLKNHVVTDIVFIYKWEHAQLDGCHWM